MSANRSSHYEMIENIKADAERCREALLALVLEAERGSLLAMRPSGAKALQEASRILKRPGFT